MNHTTLYRITAKDIVWSDCPPVTITFIAENRFAHWLAWLESAGLGDDGCPLTPTDPEPHIIHEAWTPSGDRRDWSKLDDYFWSQSAEFANQLFTAAEVEALKPHLESRLGKHDELVVEPFILPFDEAVSPLDTKHMPANPIFKLHIDTAVVRFNGCDFHCNVTGYYDRDEYQEALAVARVLPDRQSYKQPRLTIQYNADAGGYYFLIEDDHMIYKLSQPEYASQEAAVQAAWQYM